jgi:hypothetical protein
MASILEHGVNSDPPPRSNKLSGGRYRHLTKIAYRSDHYQALYAELMRLRQENGQLKKQISKIR